MTEEVRLNFMTDKSPESELRERFLVQGIEIYRRYKTIDSLFN